MLLPPVRSKTEYSLIYGDNQVWLPAMQKIAIRHGLAGEPCRQTLGTNVVYGFGNLIVKLFSPPWQDEFYTEKTVLESVQGLPTPKIVCAGEIEGWPYFIVTKLSGIPATEVWHELGTETKRDVVAQLGAFMRVLHNNNIPKNLPDDWVEFIGQRIAGAISHHNMGEPWRSWITDQLYGFQEPPVQNVLLNGDLTQDHILLTEKDNRWVISGLIDFGDARVGHPYYDFILPLLDYTYGEPELSGVLLDAYGLAQQPEVFDTLTKYCLLHEFATLGDHIERVPAKSPEQFYRILWGRE